MQSVIGVDLSGLSSGTRGRTWAAELALDQPPQLVASVRIGRGVAGDRELVGIADRQPLVAIDALLTLPHSIVCDNADCPRCAVGAASYLERDVDKVVRADGGAMPTLAVEGLKPGWYILNATYAGDATRWPARAHVEASIR